MDPQPDGCATASFAWMPRIIPASHGASFVDLHGRLWEIATWMPGRADFAQAPSSASRECLQLTGRTSPGLACP